MQGYKGGYKGTEATGAGEPTQGASAIAGDRFSSFCLCFIDECELDNVSFIGVVDDDETSSSCVDEYKKDLTTTLASSAQEAKIRATSELGTGSHWRGYKA